MRAAVRGLRAAADQLSAEDSARGGSRVRETVARIHSDRSSAAHSLSGLGLYFRLGQRGSLGSAKVSAVKALGRTSRPFKSGGAGCEISLALMPAPIDSAAARHLACGLYFRGNRTPLPEAGDDRTLLPLAWRRPGKSGAWKLPQLLITMRLATWLPSTRYRSPFGPYFRQNHLPMSDRASRTLLPPEMLLAFSRPSALGAAISP